MPCFNTNDLIGYPSNRVVRRFQAATGALLRTRLSDALEDCGWEIEQRNIAGINPGTGFVATSQKHPWCSEQEEPEDFIGRAKVYFHAMQSFNPADLQHTIFRLLSYDETITLSNDIILRPNETVYTDYEYIFIGNPFTFIIVMLGIKHRVDNAISSNRTSIISGVPQIPEILQEEDNWCKLGIKQIGFLLQFDGMRSGTLISNFTPWCGFITKGLSTYTNNNVGSFHIPFISGDAEDGKTGSKVLNNNLDNPDDWRGLLHPTILSWPTDTSDLNTTRKKAFLWDTVVFSKSLPGDTKLTFDDHEFLNLVHNAQGSTSPYRAGGSLLVTIAGNP